MKIVRMTALVGAWLMLTVCAAVAARAQTVAADVGPGDWAYAAVQDLASKGLIQGYPPDGNFLGGHAVTRFEMAAIVDRVLAYWDEQAASGGDVSALRPQLDETRKLVDEYKVELVVMGSQVSRSEAAIDQLEGQVAGVRRGLARTNARIRANAAATRVARREAEQAYSSDKRARYTVGGYIQARAVAAAGGDAAEYPEGNPIKGGAYNGTYGFGGAADSFEVRRARIRFAGAPTNNTNFALQLDASGSTANSTTQVKTKEAWVGYTFGDGSAKYPTVTAGQFATPFGYILPASMATVLTPERPLAFSENGAVGLFNNQDYSKGAKLAYALKGVALTYSIINSASQNSENIYNSFDNIYSIAYTAPRSILTVGASYYDGRVYRTPPTAGPSKGDLTYPEPRKDLADVNAQLSLPDGIFADGEYVRGTYESRDYFDWGLATPAAPTAGDSLQQDSYVKNNQVQGWYVMGGYTFHLLSPRPFTLGAEYDVFQRSMSAQNSPYDTYGVAGVSAHGDASFDDANVGWGALYNLDRATRLRLWYTDPLEVAHAPGTPAPPKIGIYTAELQVTY